LDSELESISASVENAIVARITVTVPVYIISIIRSLGSENAIEVLLSTVATAT